MEEEHAACVGQHNRQRAAIQDAKTRLVTLLFSHQRLFMWILPNTYP
jgi:hypothetical protein